MHSSKDLFIHYSLGGNASHHISYLFMDSILICRNVSYKAIVLNESIKPFFSGDLDRGKGHM